MHRRKKHRPSHAGRPTEFGYYSDGAMFFLGVVVLVIGVPALAVWLSS